MSGALFVIFGATGDLMHRKLLPALFSLKSKGYLPKEFAIVGIARKDKTSDQFREEAKKSVSSISKKLDQAKWEEFSKSLFYCRRDFDAGERFSEMKSYFQDLDKRFNTNGNRIYYLATMPEHFENIVNNLKDSGCVDRNGGRSQRIIIEKPFGKDRASAKELNDKLRRVFSEDEIYRIDHYLGKETVQNLFAFRFANRIFEPAWNREHIDNVQITVAETLGVEKRGNYYDNYGALKDMVQNHILQVMSIVAMDPPGSFSTKEIKDAKVKVLKDISAMGDIGKNTLFGQYEGYRNEPGVSESSITETFAALKLCIGNDRWAGVPFYLRTGKSLKRKASEVVVTFKGPNSSVFPDAVSNVLVVRLQPDEGIYLRFNAKEPGNEYKLQEVSMDFCHECLFPMNTPEAYEKLLYDAINNDPALFTRWDEVEAAWGVVDPIANHWHRAGKRPTGYKKGTWGPEEANGILEDGDSWSVPL